MTLLNRQNFKESLLLSHQICHKCDSQCLKKLDSVVPPNLLHIELCWSTCKATNLTNDSKNVYHKPDSPDWWKLAKHLKKPHILPCSLTKSSTIMNHCITVTNLTMLNGPICHETGSTDQQVCDMYHSADSPNLPDPSPGTAPSLPQQGSQTRKGQKERQSYVAII